MPRAEWVAFSNFSIWLGAGGGLMLSTIQGGGYSSNGLSFAGQTQTPIGFDFSPRVGASFKISDKSILDFNLGYTTFGGSFTGTYSSSTTSGTFSDNFKRNWTNFFVRWGINL